MSGKLLTNTDEESGLHYNWNRYYDPFTGKYFSPDPLLLFPYFTHFGSYPYSYAMNNPSLLTDFTGKSAKEIGKCVIVWLATKSCTENPRLCSSLPPDYTMCCVTECKGSGNYMLLYDACAIAAQQKMIDCIEPCRKGIKKCIPG